MKIIFPTDFSPNAAQAFPFAVEIARKLNAVIYVLHTYQLPYQRSDMFVSVMDIMKQDAERAVHKFMTDTAANPAFAGLKLEPVVRIGDVADTCVELAEEIKAGLIVMGTTGASGLEEVFMGSNAAATISKAKIPVLSIPPGSIWSEPRRLGFAYDLSDVDQSAIEFLKQISLAYNSELLVLHVQEDDKDAREQNPEASVANLFAGLQYQFFQTEEGDVEEAIHKFAEVYQPDWMILIHHERGFLQRLFGNSLTKQVAYHTKLPMLALHQNNK